MRTYAKADTSKLLSNVIERFKLVILRLRVNSGKVLRFDHYFIAIRRQLEQYGKKSCFTL